LFRAVVLSAWACAVAHGGASVSRENLAKAEELYLHTDYEGSVALLDRHSNDAATLFLLGRDYFMMGDFKRATDLLQKAAAVEPHNSEYADWVGKAFGKRAETSSPLTALGMASKARQWFELSVNLDPANKDALADLFDYYLEAPGFLGGGYDKAYAVAEKMAIVDPPEAYFAKAKLDQKRKEYSSAEQHLRESIAAAPHQIGHMIALAKFLANQGRTRESDEVFLAAQKDDPNAARLWFARADVLIRQKRNLQEARELLKKYVNAPTTVDDPPKQEALRLLKQVGGA